MKLSCALLACDANEKYLSFWPLVKRAWNNIIGIPAVMVFIGDEKPAHLADDPWVQLFKPVACWPTATQAQMIRLLYPSLIQCDGAIVIGDMDCIPLNRDFFHSHFAAASENQFVSTKAPMESCAEVAIMYVGATSDTWRDMFNIRSLDEVRQRMEVWAKSYSSDGQHGGLGWTSDQLQLYRKVAEWNKRCPERLAISSWAWDYPRLDRGMPYEWLSMTPFLESRLRYSHYIDFHCPPLEQFRQQIEEVLRVAEEISRQVK